MSGNRESPSAGGDQPRPSVDELADLIGATVVGDGSLGIDQVAALDRAVPGAISFLANARYRDKLAATQASAVVVRPGEVHDEPGDRAYLVCDDPYGAFARIARHLNPPSAPEPGVAGTAVVAPDAVLGADVSIGPGAVIEARAQLAAGVAIGPNAVVGADAVVGEESRLEANVTVYAGCIIGSRTVIHSGTVIGADGFGFAQTDGVWGKIPQLGTVVIGDDVEIGANSCVDCASLGETVIEDGVKLDNFVQIGHGVRIGANTIMAARSGSAGSTVLGPGCQVAAGVGIGGHLTIAGGTVITAMSMITEDIPEPGMYSSGTVMSPTKQWRRNAVRFNELDRTVRRVRALERRVNEGPNDTKGDA